MTKLPYSEGTWLAVPVLDQWAIGLVARVAPGGRIVLGYFFSPLHDTPPSLQEIPEYHADDAAFISRCSDLYILTGRWKVLGKKDSWDRRLWPMPVFCEKTGAGGTFRVVRPDDNPNGPEKRFRISPEECEGLPDDSAMGSLFVEVMLAQTLSSASSEEIDAWEDRMLALLVPNDHESPDAQHYLYFESKKVAEAVRRRVATLGYTGEVRESDEQWLVLVKQVTVPSDEALHLATAQLEELADEFGGEYDGWEQKVKG